jgi:ABC-type glycerol-3-phosphate transport system substrate-binding protein
VTVTKLARLLVVCAAVLALAAGVSACGGGSNDKSEVQSRVKTIFSGFADKDAGKICDSLSKKYKERITKRPLGKAGTQSCEKVMALVLSIGGKQLNQVDQTKVAGVNVDGDNATANVVYKGGKKGKVVLTKEDGDWLVNNFNFR